MLTHTIELGLHSILTEKTGAVILFSKENLLFCDCRIIRAAVLKKTDKMNDWHLLGGYAFLHSAAYDLHVQCGV